MGVLGDTSWVSQEWPWVSRETHHGCLRNGHGCHDRMELELRLHQECPEMVKLVMELHHVSQGGKQRKFRDGGASVWASPCEFQW